MSKKSKNCFNFSSFPELLVHAVKTTKHLKQRLSDLKEFLDAEIAAVNIFVYKNNNRFHNDKGFKDVRLVQKSWHRFQWIELNKVAAGFSDSLPLVFDLKRIGNRGPVYLPTRQMLQFLLVRLRGSFHLLHKLQILPLRLAASVSWS